MPDSRPALNGDTVLTALALTELQREVVLDEIFLIPPRRLFPEAPTSPRTLRELAAASGLTEAETALRLARIVEMSRELAAPVPAGEPVVTLDVTRPWDVQEELPRLRAAAAVLVTGGDGRKAYSTAMFLKQHGVHAARTGPLGCCDGAAALPGAR